MPTKTLATRQEPSYGWVTADPQKSTGLSQAAIDSLKYNYGIDATKNIPSYADIERQEKSVQQFASLIPHIPTAWLDPVGDFGKTPQQAKADGLRRLYGHTMAPGQLERYVLRDPAQEAYDSLPAQERQSLAYIPNVSWRNSAAQNSLRWTDESLRKQAHAAIKAGKDPLSTVNLGNNPEWTRNRLATVLANDRLQMEGVLPEYVRQLANPASWSNPYLSRYYDGPNASQVSFKGGPWSAIDATNRSKTWGGEDFADDVFAYYKSIASPGRIGANISNLVENPYARSVQFNEQQAYFTPYDYAIHGVTPENELGTQISSLDPRFWQERGNLQQLPDGTWGFVTQDNPFAGGANPTTTLSPENVALKYKYNKSSGPLGGGFGSILGKVASYFVPALGIPSLIASGAQMFDKNTPNAPSITGYQPVLSPQWKPPLTQMAENTPTAAPSNFRVPQPGDPDYEAYLRGVRGGQEWGYYNT